MAISVEVKATFVEVEACFATVLQRCLKRRLEGSRDRLPSVEVAVPFRNLKGGSEEG